MTQLRSSQRDTPVAIVREARNLLLDAANSRSFMRRAELVSKADEHLQRLEGVLRDSTKK